MYIDAYIRKKHMYTSLYTHMDIYIYTDAYIRKKDMYTSMYTCKCIYAYINVHICIYLHRYDI